MAPDSATLSDRDLKQLVSAELVRPRRMREWPAVLRGAWDVRRQERAASELSGQLVLGSVVALASGVIDFVAVPEVALDNLIARALVLVPLNLIGIVLLRRGQVGVAKGIAALTLALFGASAVWASSHGGSDVIARYSMACALLLVLSLHALPFSLREKGRHALLFCVATSAAGLFPNPLPASLLLQHIVLIVVTAIGTLLHERRLAQLEAREFLLSLQERFTRQELEASNELLRELSEHDPLTGLANRRNLDAVYAAMTAGPPPAPVAVMMIDLDHFKDFNDSHGHQAGDLCLVEVARVLERTLSQHGGHVARYGGEEFVAILRDDPQAPCETIAAMLCAAIADLPIRTAATQPCTVTASIGVARGEPGQPIGSLIARADEALYRAKQRGRNRCELAYAGGGTLG